MTTLEPTKCCGIMEINNLSESPTPLFALKMIAPALRLGFQGFSKNNPPQYVIFSGVTKRMIADHVSRRVDDYGQAFADFLVNNNLGPVVASENRVNWTGNELRVWIWHPNYRTVWPFLELEKANG